MRPAFLPPPRAPGRAGTAARPASSRGRCDVLGQLVEDIADEAADPVVGAGCEQRGVLEQQGEEGIDFGWRQVFGGDPRDPAKRSGRTCRPNPPAR